jgi:alpha-L-fucosidase
MDLTPQDVRFTLKGRTLYAFVMGWPEGPARIKALAVKSAQPVKVRNVEMLGHKGKLKWVQGNTELTVDMPPEKPCEHAVTLKVTLA